MALASTSYNSDSTTTDFPVTFTYLSRDDVSVFVDGVDTTDVSSIYEASFQDDTTIRVTAVSGGTAVPTGSVIKIQRTTDTSSAAVVFADGAVVRANALNKNTDQLLYIAQEVKDEGTSRIGLAVDDTYDFAGKRAKNLADPVDAQDAATKTWTTAQFNSGIDAGAAQTAAEAAQAAAEAAQAAAETAQAAAELAEAEAEAAEAQTFLDAGATAADRIAVAADELSAAQSAADAAASEANAATSESNAAASESAAAISNSAANIAKLAAETAQLAAETAQNDAEIAESGATTQAGLATTAAGNAAASEGSALTSKVAAAASETNAGISETNAAAAETAAEAARDAAQSARDSALSAFDNFDDKYLGAMASDPATDNDGDPLVAGALYFNETDSNIKVYTGSAWVSAYANGADFAAIVGATFTGDVEAPTLEATTSIVLGAYTFSLNSGTLIISNSTTDIAKLDASGNLTVKGDVTAFGTI